VAATKPDQGKPPARKPIIRSPYVRLPSKKFLIPYGILKALAMLVGFVGTVVLLMAVIGLATENVWAHLGGAVVIAVLVPLVIAERLLPKHDPVRGKGIVTDVLAVSWLGTTFVFAFALGPVTGPLLATEGDRLAAAGLGPPSEIAFLLAGPVAPATSASAAASASGADAGAGPPPGPFPAEVDADAPRVEPPPAPTVKPSADRTAADLFKDLAPAVVSIGVKSKRGEGGGTGFLLDDIGTIATNHHVVDSAFAVSIKFMGGQRYEVVDLLVDDAAHDLALLRVDLASPSDAGAPTDGGVTATPLVLGDSDAVTVGERAISIGNPLGLEHTLTDGLVSARRVFEGRNWIQMSVPISPGNSGGPLFNMRGEVIGITTGQIGSLFVQAQNLNLAIPVNALKALLKPTYPERRRIGDESARTQW
jgi:S1-C subfamily serine protease